MAIPAAAILLGIDLIAKVVRPLFADFTKNRGDKHLSLEQRLEKTQGIVEELGKGMIQIGAALEETKSALEAAERSRQKMESRIQKLTWMLIATSGLAIAAMILTWSR